MLTERNVARRVFACWAEKPGRWIGGIVLAFIGSSFESLGCVPRKSEDFLNVMFGERNISLVLQPYQLLLATIN